MRSLLFLLALMASAPLSATILPVDRIVAVVNGDVVLESELDNRIRTLRAQLQQRNTPVPPNDVFRRQVLERLIMSHLQLQAAETSGIRVDDNTLNRAIGGMARQNGMNIGDFRTALEAEGFNFEAFREDIRGEMIISRLLQQRVQRRITVTDQEVDNFLATNKTQSSGNKDYRLSHILVAVPERASPEQVEAASNKALQAIARLKSGESFAQVAAASSDGQQAFEGGDLGWRKAAELPTLFAEIVAKMREGDISEPIRSPSGFHVIQLAEIRGGLERHVIGQTMSRHILIRKDELTSDDVAQNRLQQLLIRLEGGEDFGALARAHSDDRGSAAKGGELGWSSPGQLVPQFEAEMDKLQIGQISQPFQTQFGWHIVQVLDRRQHDDTEQFLRNKAREFISKRKADEETEAWLRRIRDEAFVEYRLDEL